MVTILGISYDRNYQLGYAQNRLNHQFEPPEKSLTSSVHPLHLYPVLLQALFCCTFLLNCPPPSLVLIFPQIPYGTHSVKFIAYPRLNIEAENGLHFQGFAFFSF